MHDGQTRRTDDIETPDAVTYEFRLINQSDVTVFTLSGIETDETEIEVEPTVSFYGSSELTCEIWAVKSGVESVHFSHTFDYTVEIEGVMQFESGYTAPAGDAVNMQFEE